MRHTQYSNYHNLLHAVRAFIVVLFAQGPARTYTILHIYYVYARTCTRVWATPSVAAVECARLEGSTVGGVGGNALSSMRPPSHSDAIAPGTQNSTTTHNAHTNNTRVRRRVRQRPRRKRPTATVNRARTARLYLILNRKSQNNDNASPSTHRHLSVLANGETRSRLLTIVPHCVARYDLH